MKYLLFLSATLFFSCQSKRKLTTTVAERQINDTLGDNKSSKGNRYDTIFTITDRDIKGDKNFKLTYTFKLSNTSQRIITNILFSRGKKNSTSDMDKMYGKENTKYEEINKEVNIKPKETKEFSFRTIYTKLSDIYFHNEWRVIKIRFQNGEILEVDDSPFAN